MRFYAFLYATAPCDPHFIIFPSNPLPTHTFHLEIPQPCPSSCNWSAACFWPTFPLRAGFFRSCLLIHLAPSQSHPITSLLPFQRRFPWLPFWVSSVTPCYSYRTYLVHFLLFLYIFYLCALWFPTWLKIHKDRTRVCFSHLSIPST